MPTIGIAVDIPEPFGGYLQRCREDFGDPLANAIPPHVTLLPPTVVADEDLDTFTKHCTTVAAAHEPFLLELAGTDTFRPISPVVFARLVSGMDACAALERDIRAGPVDRELEFDYHPHVTIAHHVSEAQLNAAQVGLADFSAAFVVTAIHLYHHGADDVWRPEVAFELGSPPAS